MPPRGAEAKETIRVLILRDVTQFEVSGQDLALQDLKTGGWFFKNAKFSSLTVEQKAGSPPQVHAHPIFAQGFLLTSLQGLLVW